MNQVQSDSKVIAQRSLIIILGFKKM